MFIAVLSIPVPMYYYFFIFFSWARKSKYDKACADFNFGSQIAIDAGILDPYVCPRDGISRLVCDESFPVKASQTITPSELTVQDVVVYVLVGNALNVDPLLWWLKFSIDIALEERKT